MQPTLTDEMREALAARQGGPLDVIDPVTRARYVLVRADLYEQVRKQMQPEPAGRPEPAAQRFEVPPGIRRSQEAFRRDLPAFLEDRKLRGRWVLYHGDERIGFARTQRELVQEYLRRGWTTEECYVGKVTPTELEVEEEIDPSLFEFEEIEPAESSEHRQ